LGATTDRQMTNFFTKTHGTDERHQTNDAESSLGGTAKARIRSEHPIIVGVGESRQKIESELLIRI
jgi:hypothetical protein